MVNSMTGFAAGSGQFGPYAWTCEIRSVNGRGLDLRLRVPDWVDGLEKALRDKMGKALTRGTVNVAIKISRNDEIGAPRINTEQLGHVIAALRDIEEAAMASDLSLTPANPTEILAMRGVMDTSAPDDETADLRAALIAHMDEVFAEFIAARAAEGAQVADMLLGQVNTIDTLVKRAEAIWQERADHRRQAVTDMVTAVLTDTEIDKSRLEQELALLAIKQDVSEEIDRLKAHVETAHGLIASKVASGRKLDFLTQEFNREANTLCSKAQYIQLTEIGLDLKATIDQMREQVQNVE